MLATVGERAKITSKLTLDIYLKLYFTTVAI